jgi:hypothetical protein
MAEDNTTYEYTCGDQTGFEYYVLGDDIRKEFDFLKSSGTGNSTIAGNLDEMLKHLKVATSNTDAFYFENGSTITDFNDVYLEIEKDVKDLKSGLDVLHKAIMTDIDNVNAELDKNFGYWKGRKLGRKESKKS